MNEDELKRRTKQFSLRIMKLVAALPNTVGRTIAGQLVRCGTSVGANYRSACRGRRSRLEFIAKLGIVEEEADESAFWMELSIESGLMRRGVVVPLLAEANELTAIMTSSRKSASRRK